MSDSKKTIMIKYPRPSIEGGLFLSDEELDILDQVKYPSALYDIMTNIVMSAFPSLRAQLPKRQFELFKKLDVK